MNWEAIGAIGEIIGAAAVALTLGYFAIQLRASKDAAADANRLERAKGVREMMLATSLNAEFKEIITKGLQLENYYEELGTDLNMTPEEASTFDWAKPALEKDFVSFVDRTLTAKDEGSNLSP